MTTRFSMLEIFFRSLAFYSALILLVIWPLPHTIALRNIALYVGFSGGLCWWFVYRPRLIMSDLLLVGLMLMIPAWLCLRYFFMPSNLNLQLYELKGTWIRISLGVVFAACLGRMMLIYPKMLLGIFLSLLILPFYSFLMYFYQSIISHQWIFNNFTGPFKTKIGAVYFGLWMALVGFGILIHQIGKLENSKKLNLKTYKWIFIGVLLILVSAINFFVYQALNGILLLGVCGIFFIILYIKMLISVHDKLNWTRFATLLAIFLTVVCALWAYWNYDSQRGQKLHNLYSDARIAVQIDRQSSWQRSSAVNGTHDPVGQDGIVINTSTYERLSWFVKGLQYIQENPLGLGYSQKAFHQLMSRDYPGSVAPMTHSGWIDYCLGTGLPGLLLLWFVFLAVARMAYRATIVDLKSPWPVVCLWMLGGIWLLWFPGELSEREYLEHLFFMLALMATSLNHQLQTNA